MPDLATPAPESKISAMFRALKYRNYRLFFMGQGVSLIGTWMQQVALSWLVYRLTDSVFLLGILGFASQIPSFLLGPFAGVVSDRRNKHRILLATQTLSLIQASTLAALVLTDHITVPIIIALSVFMGIINAFDISARQSFVIELIDDRKDISNAIALNSSMFNMARLVGPSVAGLVIAAVGEGMCFLGNAVSYIAVLGSLLAIKTTPIISEKKQLPVFHSLKEGFTYAFGFPPIRSIILLIASISLFAMPLTVLMPVFARDVLHSNANTMGFLMGASGIGALTGALFLAQRKSVMGLGNIIVRATVLLGAGLIAFSFSRIMALSLFCMLFTGFGMIVQMASSNTILQTIVDDDKRGRVMSFYSMAFLGMAPFGSLLSGALADLVGVNYTLFICGILCLAAIIPFALQLPKMRLMVKPIYERLGIIPQVATGLQTADALTTPPREQ
ncbi:MFS transporter [Adhaeribacter soli]|nr:MFS transporter [Adhaeribacter soli]